MSDCCNGPFAGVHGFDEAMLGIQRLNVWRIVYADVCLLGLASAFTIRS